MDGHHFYIEDLKRLENQMPLLQKLPPLVEISQVVTPLNARAWDRQLQELPNQKCAEFVPQGLRNGFRIGFD